MNRNGGNNRRKRRRGVAKWELQVGLLEREEARIFVYIGGKCDKMIKKTYLCTKLL